MDKRDFRGGIKIMYEWNGDIYNDEDELKEAMFEYYGRHCKSIDYINEVLIPSAWLYEVKIL